MRRWIVCVVMVAACHSDEAKQTPPNKPAHPFEEVAALPTHSRFTALATSPDGGYCAAGFFEGTLELAGKTVTARGTGYNQTDGLVACFGADHKARWMQTVSSLGADWVRGVAIDRTGDVVVVASFGLTDEGTLGVTADLGGTTIAPVGKNRSLVARFGSDGSLKWAKVVGSGTGTIAPEAIAIAPGGQLVTCGSIYGDVTFGPSKGSARSGGFVALLTKDGEPSWLVPVVAAEAAGLVNLVIGADGTAYAVGYYSGELAIGDRKIPSAGRADGLVIAIKSDGTLAWQRSIGGALDDGVDGIAADGEGGLVIAGSFGGTVEVAGTKRTAIGQTDAFVARLGGDGTPSWFTSAGGKGRDSFRSVAVTKDAIVAVGEMSDDYKTEHVKELPNVPVTVLGKMQGGVTVVSRTGTVLWAQTFPSPNGLGLIDAVGSHGDAIIAAGATNNHATIQIAP